MRAGKGDDGPTWPAPPTGGRCDRACSEAPAWVEERPGARQRLDVPSETPEVQNRELGRRGRQGQLGEDPVVTDESSRGSEGLDDADGERDEPEWEHHPPGQRVGRSGHRPLGAGVVRAEPDHRECEKRRDGTEAVRSVYDDHHPS